MKTKIFQLKYTNHFLLISCTCLTYLTIASGAVSAQFINTELVHSVPELEYVQNQGQWEGSFLFKSQLPSATAYLFNDRIILDLQSPDDRRKLHDRLSADEPTPVQLSRLEIEFIQCNTIVPVGLENKSYYHNYFLGKDPANWKSRIFPASRIRYPNLWNGIDLEVYSQGKQIKYEFIVHPGANPGQIKMRIQGAKNIALGEAGLEIGTAVQTIYDLPPVSYLFADPSWRVGCAYQLNGNILSFQLDDYDQSKDLIIDPTLVANTLVGASGAFALGSGSLLDQQGNIYIFSLATDVLPVSPWAIDSLVPQTEIEPSNFQADFGISKFDPSGMTLEWCTYLGGSQDDFETDFLIYPDGSLLLSGYTRSQDFPILLDAYDIENVSTVIPIDAVISRISADGTELLGSTYFGGSSVDGFHNYVNWNTGIPGFSGQYNSGLSFSPTGSILLGSSSTSIDLQYTSFIGSDLFEPIEAILGFSYSNIFVASFSNDLKELNWCTLIGDSMGQSVADLKVLKNGNIAFCGETKGAQMPLGPEPYDSQFHGQNDGYVGILSADGSELLAGTYFGSTGVDETLFIDEDSEGNLWTFGFTNDGIPTLGDQYSNPGSWQYVAKFDPTLSNLLLCSEVGAGDDPDNSIVPNSFLLDPCDRIYLTGYLAGAPNNILEGFDTTDEPLFDTGGFYLGVFEKDMADILQGSYLPGNHLHSGGSRHSKKGIICHGLCSPNFNSASSFVPLQAGYDLVQNDEDYEAAVYVIDLNLASTVSSFTYSPQTSCLPYTVEFSNWSTPGSYLWNFGVTDSWLESDEQQLNYTYTIPGDYLVQLAVWNDTTCNVADTMKFVIHVPQISSDLSMQWDVLSSDLCLDSFSIDGAFTGSGADSLSWEFNDTSSSGNSASFTAESPGNYLLYLIGFDQGCSYSDSLIMLFQSGPPVLLDTATFSGNPCTGSELNFTAETNAPDVIWNFGDQTPPATGLSTSHEYEDADTYLVEIIALSETGCIQSDTLYITADIHDLPVVEFYLPDTICSQLPNFPLDQGLPAGGDYSGPGVSDNVLHPGDAGTGEIVISYLFTDQWGCTNSASDTTLIEICQGTPELSEALVLDIFPNPGAESIAFSFSASPIEDLAIYNAWSQLVYSIKADHPGHRLDLDVNNWAAGAYFVHFTAENGFSTHRPFCIIH